MENRWKLATFVLAGFIVGFLTAEGVNMVRGTPLSGAKGKPAAQEVAKAAEEPKPSAPVLPTPDDDPVMGDKDAPVTIIEFSDFQCPFCNRFFRETLPTLKERYIKTGKAKLVYRDFPLPKHTEADETAEAAECARAQGEENFWKMHDMIFLRVDEWAGNTDVKKILSGFAKNIALDVKEFDKCLSEGTYREEVLKDLRDGVNAKVSGTPSFFINGEPVEGAQPFEVFEEVIERKLSEKN